MTAQDVSGLDQATYSPAATLYPDVYAWVAEFLAQLYARPVTEQDTAFRWCPRWWEHAEAMTRLDALWRAWETLRRDPGTGPATWFGYADSCMTALTAPAGTFSRCSPTTHKVPPPLPCEPAPADL